MGVPDLRYVEHMGGLFWLVLAWTGPWLCVMTPLPVETIC